MRRTISSIIRRTVVIGLAISVCGGMLAAEPSSAKKKKIKEKPIKHYIDIYGAGGVSSFGMALEGGKTSIGGSFTFGAGYTWFFKPYMGLQTGVSLTRLSGSAALTEPMEWTKQADGTPITDYMGEVYTHRTTFDNWREKQQSYLVQIPIGLRFRYFADNSSKAGLHAAAGVNLAIPVITSYAHTSGSVTHMGWYEQWQLTITDLPGRFGTETLTTKQEESINNKVNLLNAQVYGEIGTSIRLNRRSELFIAAYAQYMINDFSAVKRDARTPLGFSGSTYNYPFMSEYRGLIGTDKVGTLHPWVAGLKIGVSIWPGKSDIDRIRELKKLAKRYPDEMPVREIHDTIYIHDTIVTIVEKPVERVVAKEQAKSSAQTPTFTGVHAELDELLSQVTIWFHFDDYTPILEPEDILDKIVAMLLEHPELKIQVNGHACKIGKDSYNKQLALRRAKAVARLLEQKGISRDRMKIQSFGSSHPYRYNKPASPKDRRVEIIPD